MMRPSLVRNQLLVTDRGGALRGAGLVAAVMTLLGSSPLMAETRSDRLIQKLEQGSLRVRLQAVLLLGEIRDPQSMPALTKLLGDPQPVLRAAGAAALGKMGAAEAADALVQCLSDREATVRLEATKALGELRVAGAISPLARALPGRGSRDHDR